VYVLQGDASPVAYVTFPRKVRMIYSWKDSYSCRSYELIAGKALQGLAYLS
jgi:hypothetical protein